MGWRGAHSSGTDPICHLKQHRLGLIRNFMNVNPFSPATDLWAFGSSSVFSPFSPSGETSPPSSVLPWVMWFLIFTLLDP